MINFEEKILNKVKNDCDSLKESKILEISKKAHEFAKASFLGVETRKPFLIIKIISLFQSFAQDLDYYLNNENLLIEDLKELDEEGELEEKDWSVVGTALINLNKNYYDSYLEFALAAKGNFYSALVKRADITHNLLELKGKKRDKYLLAKWILEN